MKVFVEQLIDELRENPNKFKPYAFTSDVCGFKGLGFVFYSVCGWELLSEQRKIKTTWKERRALKKAYKEWFDNIDIEGLNGISKEHSIGRDI